MLSVFRELACPCSGAEALAQADGFSKDRCLRFHGHLDSKRYDSKQVQGFKDYWISNLMYIITVSGNVWFPWSQKILGSEGKGADFQRDSFCAKPKKKTPRLELRGFHRVGTLTVF